MILRESDRPIGTQGCWYTTCDDPPAVRFGSYCTRCDSLWNAEHCDAHYERWMAVISGRSLISPICTACNESGVGVMAASEPIRLRTPAATR